MARRELSEAALAPADTLAPVDLAIGLLTYNNAETIDDVLAAATAGVAELGVGRAALIVADAGSSDDTRARAAGCTLPSVIVEHEAPAGERVAVPFHGVPGRGAALRAAFRLRHLLNNPELIARMGAAGREHVRRSFLITRHLTDYMAMLIHLTR